jgi:phage terminase large subunit-like protein
VKNKLTLDDINLDDLVYLQDKYKAELSLYEFIKQAWAASAIEGGTQFTDGWHIRVICEHLEAIANRQIKNLIINMPPRYSKSSIVSVAFPAWVWVNAPHEQFMYCSYASSLALRDSVRCRRLMLSPWYQKRWGNRFQLVGDQNTKGRFDNNRSGYRMTTSTGGSITGEGGSMLIADDPNNTKDGDNSDVKRERTIEWWNHVWSTRLNDKKNDCRVVVQQRYHMRDITGYITSQDTELKEWTNLILPAEYEPEYKRKTILLPSTNGKVWEDPRQNDGDLLWPERFDEKAMKSIKNALGSEAAIAGQLQQRPSSREGNIIKKAWFQWWKDAQPPQIEFVVQSWDTAFSEKKTAAYSACTTWGVFYDHNYIENVILLSMWRGRVEYVELREIAKRLYHDYRDTGKVHESKFKGRPIDLFLIEARASGDPLIKDLQSAGIKAIPVDPAGRGNKIQRLNFVTPLLEGERVWLPARPPSFDHLLPFADELLENVACYPNLESNDIVDTMSQAFMKLKTGMFLLNPRDERPEPEMRKEVKVY